MSECELCRQRLAVTEVLLHAHMDVCVCTMLVVFSQLVFTFLFFCFDGYSVHVCFWAACLTILQATSFVTTIACCSGSSRWTEKSELSAACTAVCKPTPACSACTIVSARWSTATGASTRSSQHPSQVPSDRQTTSIGFVDGCASSHPKSRLSRFRSARKRPLIHPLGLHTERKSQCGALFADGGRRERVNMSVSKLVRLLKPYTPRVH